MRKLNNTIKAFKEVDSESKEWYIYFDPKPKLDGYFYYSILQGFIDEAVAEEIVKLLAIKFK